MGGGNPATVGSGLLLGGLSPRGRGKRDGPRQMLLSLRSIPAWAGETGRGPGRIGLGGVYPRVGGGNRFRLRSRCFSRGLSPRGRGKPRKPQSTASTLRSIPAWAGETVTPLGRPDRAMVYPRVGGGNWDLTIRSMIGSGLSPRGRGKRAGRPGHPPRRRSIPAWAGETRVQAVLGVVKRVYPRVGGGNRPHRYADSPLQGLSPRGRGKLTPWFF